MLLLRWVRLGRRGIAVCLLGGVMWPGCVQCFWHQMPASALPIRACAAAVSWNWGCEVADPDSWARLPAGARLAQRHGPRLVGHRAGQGSRDLQPGDGGYLPCCLWVVLPPHVSGTARCLHPSTWLWHCLKLSCWAAGAGLCIPMYLLSAQPPPALPALWLQLTGGPSAPCALVPMLL